MTPMGAPEYGSPEQPRYTNAQVALMTAAQAAKHSSNVVSLARTS